MLGAGPGRPSPTALDATSPRILGTRVDCSAPDGCTITWELARLPVRIYAGPTPRRIDRTTPVAKVRAGTEVTVPVADRSSPRYFEVVPRGATRGPVVADRFLPLDGAPNTRDLGGYQTLDGLRVRWGRLFRSDALASATESDRAQLAALGLPTTCPGRAPPGSVPPPAPDTPIDDATLQAAAESVTSRATRERDGTLLRALARGPLPQWVHCTLLDDRLGWPTALVLTTLGISRETVVADGLLSARRGGAPPPDRRHLDAAFDAVRRRYRTFDRYLVEGLGLDRRTYLALRNRFLEPNRVPAPSPDREPTRG